MLQAYRGVLIVLSHLLQEPLVHAGLLTKQQIPSIFIASSQILGNVKILMSLLPCAPVGCDCCHGALLAYCLGHALSLNDEGLLNMMPDSIC